MQWRAGRDGGRRRGNQDLIIVFRTYQSGTWHSAGVWGIATGRSLLQRRRKDGRVEKKG